MILSLAVPALISIVTTTSKYLLRIVSRFEKQDSLETETNSRIVKMSIFGFVTMGIIVCLNSINGEFYHVAPIAISKYKRTSFTEFSVEWYSRVSKDIVTSIFFQVFTPHLSNGMYHVANLVKRFYDQHFSCDRTKTRKLTQVDYVEVQKGNLFMIEYRFSNLITLVLVVSLYGNCLPLLYPVAFLVLFAAYWVDKFFILTNLYKKPHQFEGNVVLALNTYLKLSMLFYFVGGVLSFVNSAIMAEDTDPATTEGFTLGEFYKQKHLLIYYYGNAGLLLVGLFFTFAFPLILKCCKYKS